MANLVVRLFLCSVFTAASLQNPESTFYYALVRVVILFTITRHQLGRSLLRKFWMVQ